MAKKCGPILDAGKSGNVIAAADNVAGLLASAEWKVIKTGEKVKINFVPWQPVQRVYKELSLNRAPIAIYRSTGIDAKVA